MPWPADVTTSSQVAVRHLRQIALGLDPENVV